ncbi:hypothetical protein PIB30_083156 [Stylosanthes scabra]|uniref:Uncharacterized protein n=1 Tax=Stylosanthes scabra TaxID=79078 RepID=A0ABU6ZQY6_9FABA|nr:hypothetical protein [Stylosanthes scabra]
MGLGWGPTNDNQGESRLEGTDDRVGPIVEDTMGSGSEPESDSHSAPPGLAEWEQIKGAQSGAVRGRSVPTQKQRRRGKSRGRTSLKLKDRIQAGLKGANKRKKSKKCKEISDIDDTVWSDQDYGSGESEEDDIEDSELELERIWRVGEETGLVAKEAGTTNRYLRNKEEEEAKQRRSRETKRTRGRKKTANSEEYEIRRIWGNVDYQWEEVQAVNNGGGLICIWEKDFFQVERSTKGNRWIGLLGTLSDLKERVWVFLVYGPNSVTDRK